jgi:hypothetical protein
MSDTPRTDKIENDWKESWDRSTGQQEMSDFARQLERELNEACAINSELEKALSTIAIWAAECAVSEQTQLIIGMTAHGAITKSKQTKP